MSNQPNGMHLKSVWARPDALTMLRGLATEGYSGRHIAIVLTEAFGQRVTSGMVMGMCHRQNIVLGGGKRGRRDGAKRAKPASEKKPRERAPKAATPPVKASGNSNGRITFARRAVAAKQGLPTAVPFCDPMRKDDRADNPTGLLDLKHDTCRWPFGEPGRAGFHFCGGLAIDGQPYCARHALRARTPRIPESFKVAAE